MRNEDRISIIIPVYNVQEFLKKCVNSVSSQTYKNLEIILVNDGSTDGSGDICESLAKQDGRISVIHKENGGLADARNTGTKSAKGQYFFYLDSDDYLKLDCIEELHNAAVKFDAEVVQANFYYDYPDHLLYNNSLNGKNKIFTRQEAMESLLQQNIIKNFAWGKLIRADIAKKHLFPKDKYFEDTFWKFYIIHDCKKYVALATPMLYYLQRPASISGSFTLRNMDQIEGESLRLDFIKNNYPDYYNTSLRLFNDKVLLFKLIVSKLPFDKQLEHNTELNKFIDEYDLKKHFSTKHFIFDNRVLRRGFNLYERISKRLLPSNAWVKIYKK